MQDKVVEINHFYQRILASIGMLVTPEDIIQLNADTHPTLFINKKTAVIPSRNILNQFDKENMIAWHPLSESTFRGETEVIKKTKRLVLHRMISDLQVLSVSLMELAADHTAHARLTPDQSRFLSIAADADEKSCLRFKQFWQKTNQDENDFIRLFLSRSYEHNGTKYPRAALVSFPHLELLYPSEEDHQPTEIMGVPLRKKTPNDLKIWGDVIEYILPHIRQKHFYSGFADSGELPYFNALMRAFLKYSHQINKIANLFRTALPILNDLIKDLSWEDDLIECDKWIGMIPDLDPDDGIIKPAVASKPAASPLAAGMSRAMADVPPIPGAVPVQAQETVTEGVPFIGSAAFNRPMYPPPPGYGAPVQHSYAPPVPLDQYGRPIYQQPPPVYPSQPVVYGQQPQYPPPPVYGQYPVYDPNNDPNSRANRNRHR